MKAFLAGFLTLVAVSLMVIGPRTALGQSFVLDPMSASLPAIPATSTDILRPTGYLIPAPPPPTLAISAATLGLLPGDVIDAITYGNDGPPGSTLTFSVARPTVSAGPGPITPDVFSEVTAVPPGIQPEAAGDLFTALDPTCGVFPPFNTQIVDGNGMILGPPFTCYGGLGMGMTELLALPGPPFNDDITAFDWAYPGVYPLTGLGFSLAAGSPTLTPGTNPLLPGGAEPGDVLVSLAGSPPFPPSLFVFTGVAGLGLISGGPGCAPPACDDVDALSISFPAGGTIMFSIAAGSPSIGACGYSAADVLGGAVGPFPACAGAFLPAGAIGLAPPDDVNALESFANGCAIAPGGDVPPDGDGINGMVCDNCPPIFNPGQEDSDGDAAGDACDPCTDLDGDGFGNPGFPNAGCAVDLCPFTPGPNGDLDGDGVGDVCDNCPAVANPTQANTDFDAEGDACDLCPHVFAAGLPGPITLKKVLLIYGSTGPGSGDDKPKAIKAEFSTGAAFDPDSTDNVHVTFSDADTPPTLFAASLPAGPPWTQLSAAPKKWKYLDTTAPTGVKLMFIKEDSMTPGDYTAKVIGRFASIAGPLVGGAVTTTLEIESFGVGVCFSGVNAVCTSSAAKDKCL